MNNKEKLKGLLTDLNRMSQDVVRFKEDLQCNFRLEEEQYNMKVLTKHPFLISKTIKVKIIYIDRTLSRDNVILMKCYEGLEDSDTVINSVYGLVYQEFLRYLIFLNPSKYITNLGTHYAIPIRDLLSKGYEKCTKEIDENELRSNSENKE